MSDLKQAEASLEKKADSLIKKFKTRRSWQVLGAVIFGLVTATLVFNARAVNSADGLVLGIDSNNCNNSQGTMIKESSSNSNKKNVNTCQLTSNKQFAPVLFRYGSTNINSQTGNHTAAIAEFKSRDKNTAETCFFMRSVEGNAIVTLFGLAEDGKKITDTTVTANNYEEYCIKSNITAGEQNIGVLVNSGTVRISSALIYLTKIVVEPNEGNPPFYPIDASIYDPIAGCPDGNIVPLGQASGAHLIEPLGSIWCFNLKDPGITTAVSEANSWFDDFDVSKQLSGDDKLMIQFNDGDFGYRVFDRAGQGPPTKTQHWINQNHWMVDAVGGQQGGASLSPNRSFKFENGVFILEGKMAASMAEYSDDTWGELTITDAPAPTGDIPDSLYAYGQFGGKWSVGCRLQASRYPVCAIYTPSSSFQPGDHCFKAGARMMEISSHQQCGTTHFGGGPFGDRANVWPTCAPDAPDVRCRATFRMEVRKNGLKLFVDDILYFEDSNWPADRQLPDSFINGNIYAYQSEWQARAGNRAYRYHWDNFGVNNR